MNEPLFTLDTGPDGTRRRFADPGRTPPERVPEDQPPLQPLRARLRAGTLAIAAGAFRSRLKLRT